MRIFRRALPVHSCVNRRRRSNRSILPDGPAPAGITVTPQAFYAQGHLVFVSASLKTQTGAPMKKWHRHLAVALAAGITATAVFAEDWPQWRGPNRDGKVTGFTAPAAWPKELAEKWRQKVGEGDATPALVGDKLYVFTRQDANEVLTCLNAADG